MEKSAQAFRTIGEVATWLDTEAYVLRFWESRFSQIKPIKRKDGRRYYRPDDMKVIGGIKTLLHGEGLTIKGVQKILKEKGASYVATLSPEIEIYENSKEKYGESTKTIETHTKSEVEIDPEQSDIRAREDINFNDDLAGYNAKQKNAFEKQELKIIVSRLKVLRDRIMHENSFDI